MLYHHDSPHKEDRSHLVVISTATHNIKRTTLPGSKGGEGREEAG